MLSDCHLHSSCSDGRLSPPDVVDAVADAGIGILALSDHDTIAGLEAAALQARRRGVIFTTGIEMTTYAYGEVVHILGLGFDPAHDALQRANDLANEVWAQNQRRWVQALQSQGHDLDCARDFSDAPVRLPVLIERLCRKGVADGNPVQCHALFRKFFAELPADAYARLPQPHAAARILRAAGGIALLAHPYSCNRSSLIDAILAQCDGLEAMYGRYTARQRSSLVSLAAAAGKLYSGGSDYHGYFSERYSNPGFEMPAALAKRLNLVLQPTSA